MSAPGDTGELAPGEVVMDIKTVSRTPMADGNIMELSQILQMRRSEIDRYLIEMVEQDTWVEGMKYMLADPNMEGRPWPTYKDEHLVWA